MRTGHTACWQTCITTYQIQGRLLHLPFSKLGRYWLRGSQPTSFDGSAARGSGELPGSVTTFLAKWAVSVNGQMWQVLSKRDIPWLARDAKEHSYLYSVGGKAQPTGPRSSRNNKHFIAPSLSGHCGCGGGHIWVSVLRRPFCAAPAGSDWEKKQINKGCLREPKTSVPNSSMTNPPPSLPRQPRAGFGCLSYQPEQNSSQWVALLKLQAFKNKRGGTPLGLLSSKDRPKLKPLILNTQGCAADQKVADLLNSFFTCVYSSLLILGAVLFA